MSNYSSNLPSSCPSSPSITGTDPFSSQEIQEIPSKLGLAPSPSPATRPSQDTDFNSPFYTLDPYIKSGIYYIKEGLFNQSLQPIKASKDREILFSYTMLK
jgi:hypothetical protein